MQSVQKEEKNEDESLIVYIVRMAEGIFFKFGMWPPLSGGNLHYKFGTIWIRHHGAMDV